MPIIIAIAITFLFPNLAHAVIRDVELPSLIGKEEYVDLLIQEYPLPEGIVHEVENDTLYLIGDGYESEKWAGYSKTESDKETEGDLVKTFGVSAVLAMGYGAFKTLKK